MRNTPVSKILFLMTIAFCLCLSVVSCSVSKETEGLFYKSEDDYYIVNGYGGEAKKIIIPDTHNGVIVKKIGFKAFEDKEITQLVLGKNVTWIDVYSFNNCRQLKDVKLSDKLDTIRGWAFSGCTSISHLEIPESCWFIGYHAFEGWTDKQTIVIHGSQDRFEAGWNESCNAKIIFK